MNVQLAPVRRLGAVIRTRFIWIYILCSLGAQELERMDARGWTPAPSSCTHGTVLADEDGRCWRKAAVSRAAKVAAARGPLTAYVARVAAAHESL